MIPDSDHRVYRWDAYAVEKARGGRGVAGGSSRLFARPIPLAVADAYDVRVDGLSITNAPFWHMITYQVEKGESHRGPD